MLLIIGLAILLCCNDYSKKERGKVAIPLLHNHQKRPPLNPRLSPGNEAMRLFPIRRPDARGAREKRLQRDNSLHRRRPERSKPYLSQFNPWLTYESCPKPKATSMLLVLIIERWSVHLEKGFRHLIHELQQQQDNSHKTSITTTTTKKAEENNSIYSKGGAGLGNAGEFQVTLGQEWCQVMRAFLVTKCKELVSAEKKLEKRGLRDKVLSSTRRRKRVEVN